MCCMARDEVDAYVSQTAGALEIAGRELARHITEKADLQERLTVLVNGILELAPSCWHIGTETDSDALEFVRSMAEETIAIPGHRVDCSCFNK